MKLRPRGIPSTNPHGTTTCRCPVRLVVVSSPLGGVTITSQSAKNFRGTRDLNYTDLRKALENGGGYFES